MSVPHAHARVHHAHPLPPTPTDSESLSDVEHEPDQHEAHGDEPWLFRLLNRAAAFADVIAQHHHSHARGRKGVSGAEGESADVEEGDAEAEADPDVMCILGHDLARMGMPGDDPSQPPVDVEEEHEQTAPDIDPSAGPVSRRSAAHSTWHHGAPHRWTLLSASSWLKRRKGGLGGDSKHDGEEEPGASDDEGEVKDVFLEESQDKIPSRGMVFSPPPAPLIQPVADAPPVSAPTPNIPAPVPIARPSDADSAAADPPVLSADQKVALIVEEFGSIVQGEEEETLLAETDASFFQDVAILGVLHLTTHRLAFHASLLSARPDLAPAAQVLRAGPAVVGVGKGGRKKRRVWMELSHDMVSTFRRSDDHARVRPLCTVLLSAFRKIHPIDPQHPRRITLEFEIATAEPRAKEQKGTRSGKKRLSKQEKKSQRTGEGKGKTGDESKHEDEERRKGKKHTLPTKIPSLSLGGERPVSGSGSSSGRGKEAGIVTHKSVESTDDDKEKFGTRGSSAPQQERSHLPSPARSSGSPASIASSIHSSPSPLHSDSEDDSDPDIDTHAKKTASPEPLSDFSPDDPSPVRIKRDTVEYDTEEAALGWRREVQAALYLYRCQRGRGRGTQPPFAEGTKTGEAGEGEGEDAGPDQDEGVRISIPLRRIEDHKIHAWENLATILQLDLGRTSIGEGEFGEGVGADIDFGVAEEILKRSKEGVGTGQGNETGVKGAETRRKGSVTGREKEAGPRRAGSGRLKRVGSLKEEQAAKPLDPCEELLTTAGPLTRGWESPKVELGAGASKGRTTDASDSPAQPHSFKLQFALLRAEPVWSRFGDLVERAQEAPAAATKPATIVDFGPLTFVEPGLDVDVGRRSTERSASTSTADSSGGEVVRRSREREVRRIFGLGDTDIWITKCSLTRTISTSGLLVISMRFICFWSRLFAASDVKLRFPTPYVRAALPVPARCHSSGMALQIYGNEDVLFEFSKEKARDEAVRKVREVLGTQEQSPSPSLSPRAGVGPLRPSATMPVSTTTLPHAQGSPLRPAMSIPAPLHSSSLASTVTTASKTSAESFPDTPALSSSPPSSLASSPPSEGRPPPTHAQTHPPTTSLLSPLSRTVAQLRGRTLPPAVLTHLAKPINVPPEIPYGIAHRHFVMLTIGSRGDVQPYIALGLGLRAAGHAVTIVTHGEYKTWVEGWGIEHRTAGGDPGALMKLNVNHKMFSPQFFKESISHFRTWIDELLVEAWEQCKDAEVLIESPPAMAGVHIAEALSIPYFRAFTMPWSRTAQYPHPFISPPVENSARFNVASYVLFDNVFWLGTSGQINRWRKKRLGLRATDMGHLAQAKIPFLYNFSPTVVPKPLDWGDQITITGFWFLDNPELNWTPSEALLQFIMRARAENKPLVYIGFGSITVPRPSAIARSIVKAVLKSDVRAILSKGWSSRMDKDTGPEIEFPPEIHITDTVPHDWLFPQVDAALHHGGAGTTGASLRAGIPTLIKPWFGDQFFWASRVQRLGVGLKVSGLHSADLADALKKATTDRVMIEKAAAVGERIRQEAGLAAAIQAIYTYLDRAGKDRTTLKD